MDSNMLAMVEDFEEEEISVPPLERLMQFMQAPNIAELLEDDELVEIGQKVLEEYEIDEDSRSDWMEKVDAAMKLAKQITEEKSYPWPKAANVKYPIIATAAIQFSARSYPAIVKDNRVVKGAVVGDDPDGEKASRAERVSEHMSYQLLCEMDEWEEEQDRQLIVLPIVGTDFKKTYFDQSIGRNVSVRVSAKNCVVNNKAKSIETAPRVTEVFTIYPYELEEKKRMGIYLDQDYMAEDSDDDYEPIEFLEQHRMLDLDDDEYPEPYIVTVHKESGKVARIVARFSPENVILVDETKAYLHSLAEHMESGMFMPMAIARIIPDHYYTKFGFMPDPDGGFYDIGLGILLNPLNESINTVLNQLLDAGHLANTGGGFIGRGLRMKRGEVRFKPGEYKTVDVPGDNIRNNIVPLQFPGPSPVLFQLLGMLISAAKEISNVSEIMTGDSQMAMAQPTTVMALIEQGQMVFSSVYKRIHRSLGKEFKKLYRLNGLYLEDVSYYTVLDNPKSIARQDYFGPDMNVKPVSDPNLATDQQKLARANFLGQFMQDPFFNPMEIRRRILEAARIDNIETLLAPPPQQEGPDPAIMIEMARLQNDRAKIDNETKKTNAQIIESIASALLNMEKAEATNAGTQLDYYTLMLQSMITGLSNGDRAGIQGMAGTPGDAMGLPMPAGGPQEFDGGMGGGETFGPGAGEMPGAMPII